MAQPQVSDWVAEVLSFWFEELKPAQWFSKDVALDELICARFIGLHERVAAAPEGELLADPTIALAAVIALDQFSRNMFRGTARSFATDAKALALADKAVARGFDWRLSENERLFLYLPFEHSEDPAMQVRSVALFTVLGDPKQRKYAEAHKAIIDRFGRFPHRNAILGRRSTAAEEAFLEKPGSSF
jgi:uncharacterized protein (DUF924 family)